MAVMPPERNDALPAGIYPEWALIGPALATIVGVFLVTGVYRGDWISPIQMELDMSSQAFLLEGVVTYLIAAAIAFPPGYLLCARFLTPAITSAIGVMLIGVLIVAFGGGAGTLLIGRVLGGLGAGAALGVTTALVRSIRRGRGIATAAVSAAGVVTVLVAPFAGQLISDALSFRLVYLAAVPFLLVALLAATVSGIALVMARRSAPPVPYGMPYPSPEYRH
ncbi:hypothetical protein [Nocardia sp. NPDC019395]|uniref:hypothetical protein n=1 Tax=Nocardia sp. NPDC019395 TaxID=3154686 RepID=UPI0033D5BCA2